jgi:hypothetical protein
MYLEGFWRFWMFREKFFGFFGVSFFGLFSFRVLSLRRGSLLLLLLRKRSSSVRPLIRAVGKARRKGGREGDKRRKSKDEEKERGEKIEN